MLSRPCLLPCLNGTDLLLIVDGMDQGKFAFPRHRALKAKEFANFQRPPRACHRMYFTRPGDSFRSDRP